VAKFGFQARGDRTNPFTPEPNIIITLEEWRGGEDGEPIALSPDCMTEQEIDGQINYLIEGLRKVAKNAKAALKRRRSNLKSN